MVEAEEEAEVETDQMEAEEEVEGETGQVEVDLIMVVGLTTEVNLTTGLRYIVKFS